MTATRLLWKPLVVLILKNSLTPRWNLPAFILTNPSLNKRSEGKFMPKDFQQFLTVKEYRKACQFLLDCHSLMFESQLCDLMILSQKSINRLTHKLAECGLVKVHKQGKSNVISLTRTAAQHLLGLNSPPWLPEPNSTTALWNGAYAADYLNKSRHRFIPAPQY